MNVKSVALSRFMSHDSSTYELPDSGVVVITGPNGAGKSSLIEGVSLALWGKTLRGTSPWRPGSAGEVSVETDIASASVHMSKTGRASLMWAPLGDAAAEAMLAGTPVVYENTTKAREALERVVGAHDVWRRSCVFSSSDASHFTLATDADRKRLLEALLGLDRFDTALDKCRAHLKLSQDLYNEASRRAASLSERVDGWLRTLANSEESLRDLASTTDLDKLEDRAARLGKMIEGTAQELAALLEKQDAARNDSRRAEQDVAEAERHHARVAAGTCLTCGQDAVEVAKTFAQEVAQARVTALQLKTERDKTVAEVAGQIQELEGERKELRTQREQALGELGAAHAVAKQRTKIKEQSREAERGLEDATVELAGARSAVRDHTAEVAELTACSQVLGLRGVRANVLGRALVGIEAAANAWLSKLAGGDLRLSLLSSVERKSGGSQDVIGLEVQGAGGGNGYRGASAGERRRIDVALLLALGEVAAGAAGRSPGDIYFDEVFDSLDADGVSAAVKAITDMAQTRKVFVITHNEDLARQLPCVQHYRIENGTTRLL